MKVRMVQHGGGLKFYADRPALKQLAAELERLASSPIGEHFEFQTLEWVGNADLKVFECYEYVDHSNLVRIPPDEFDLNFMTLEDTDFEKFESDATKG